MGSVPGWRFRVRFGFSDDISTAERLIWDGPGGAYPYPAVAAVVTVSSDDANDTSAGSGAQTVTISGLDAGFFEITEDVVMDGVTPVTTTLEYLRIFGLRVSSGAENVGIIYAGTGTVTSGEPAVILAQMIAGMAATSSAQFTVPADHSAILRAITVGGDSTQGTIVRFRARIAGIFVTQFRLVLQGALVTSSANLAVVYPEKTDLEMLARVPAGANIDAFASYALDLVQIR